MPTLADRIRDWLTKENPVWRGIRSFVSPGSPVFPQDNFKALTSASYLENVYAFAAVREAANAFASIGWRLFRTGAGDDQELTEHAALDLVRTPNPMQGGTQFWFSVAAFYRLDGNAYVTGAGPVNGPPMELWWARPDRVKIIPSADGNMIAGYEYEGQKTLLPPEDVMHIRDFHPLDDWYGMGFTRPAKFALTSNNEAKKWNVATLQNSAKPAGILSTEGELTERQRQRMEEQKRDKWQGASNAGDVKVLEGGLTWQQMSMSPTDMDWIEGQVLTAREIAVAANVAPELLGDSANKTYSNVREARKALYQENAIPLAMVVADELNRWLLPQFPDGENLEFRPDIEGIEALKDDRESAAAAAVQLFTSGIATRGEAREMVGLQADTEDSDLFVLPSNLLPADAGEARAANVVHLRSVGIKTEEQKEIHWKRIDRQRAEHIKRVSAQARARLIAEAAAVARSVRSVGIAQAETAARAVLLEQREAWLEYLSETYLEVGERFARGVWADLGVQQRSVVGGTEIKQGDLIDPWRDAMLGWLGANGTGKIVNISKTTEALIMGVVRDGAADGQSVQDIAKGITKRVDEIANFRAERIARTEIISASNLGAMEGAKVSGLELNKNWLSTKDTRTRGNKPKDKFNHIVVDGQQVEMGAPFIVDGESLQFPGDSSTASAGNTIQCRCTVTFEPKEDSQ